MHLIVDGYNLIRQSSRLQILDAMDLQAGREALLELLSHYQSRSHHRITVVFDGWQGGGLQETRDRHQGLLIVYSRRGERADEVIKRLLYKERERALVVTSDREIQSCADRVKAAWVNAHQFELTCLSGSLGPVEDDPEAEAGAGGAPKKGPARRLPKRLRRRRQRLKKL